MADENIKGSKLALFLGDQLVVLRRDNKPDIPWPDHLDLPGGGRDAGETAEDCVLRETQEEIGLHLTRHNLIYRRDYRRPHGCVAFFAAEMPAPLVHDIRFGNEGQGWMLMPPDQFAKHPEAVPHFRVQIIDYLTIRTPARAGI